MPTKAELEARIVELEDELEGEKQDFRELQKENEEMEKELDQLRPTDDPPQMMRPFEVQMLRKAQKAGKGTK